ncbi:uncharacterized protein LOC135939893 [Cloeon dipterum]|uniref:uncharacterized protein LOC135939893 n=1 Tax=Cloeon dipterum TaxID=197152 RepID=UPI0032208337
MFGTYTADHSKMGYSTGAASQRDPEMQRKHERVEHERLTNSGQSFMPNNCPNKRPYASQPSKLSMDKIENRQSQRFGSRLMSLQNTQQLTPTQGPVTGNGMRCADGNYSLSAQSSGWDSGYNSQCGGSWQYYYHGGYYQQQFSQPAPTQTPGYFTKAYNPGTSQSPSSSSNARNGGDQHSNSGHIPTAQVSAPEKPYRYPVAEHDKTPVLPMIPVRKSTRNMAHYKPYAKKARKDKSRNKKNEAAVAQRDGPVVENPVVINDIEKELTLVCSITAKYFEGANCRDCGRQFVRGEFYEYSRHVHDHDVQKRLAKAEEEQSKIGNPSIRAGPSVPAKPANWAEFKKREKEKAEKMGT